MCGGEAKEQMNAVIVVLLALFSVLLSVAVQPVAACSLCDHTSRDDFLSGSQRSDCDYSTGFTRQGPPSDEQDERDHYWVQYTHDFAVENNPAAPFGGAIVNFTSNELLCVSVNMRAVNDPVWSPRYNSHGEIVVMENCTTHFLPDYFDANGKRQANPGWKDMVLYGNIETCPMCAQSFIYRDISRAVFGARASQLMGQRCWSQATLTLQEIVDHNAEKLKGKDTYFRGPLTRLEGKILSAFPSRC